jgi:hypothetical protein
MSEMQEAVQTNVDEGITPSQTLARVTPNWIAPPLKGINSQPLNFESYGCAG